MKEERHHLNADIHTPPLFWSGKIYRIEPFKQQLVHHLATWSAPRRQGVNGGNISSSSSSSSSNGGDGGVGDLSAFLNRLCVVLAAVAVQVGREGGKNGRTRR